ncbi:uncharacterized protein ASCRUDRAFT_69152 [Ascoidea rubescens DSM 1968]|uniref:Uncharacterized protein n=1 Tax=Ascoidea rubescens DSM 1968 TaxID=1344418 RepID=A0A1D2VL69_9ASCO|nr:hypothetical protein ASCRUDRAFT_69152 [Ascoidea rubescens DSM 1968]ODV62335.1 hypothetical protein ASCRUDRAFT_69152 [Ascoidea rubescens DSM 1968]
MAEDSVLVVGLRKKKQHVEDTHEYILKRTDAAKIAEYINDNCNTTPPVTITRVAIVKGKLRTILFNYIKAVCDPDATWDEKLKKAKLPCKKSSNIDCLYFTYKGRLQLVGSSIALFF